MHKGFKISQNTIRVNISVYLNYFQIPVSHHQKCIANSQVQGALLDGQVCIPPFTFCLPRTVLRKHGLI